MSTLPQELYTKCTPLFLNMTTTRACSYISNGITQNQFYLTCKGEKAIHQGQFVSHKIEKINNTNDSTIIIGLTSNNTLNKHVMKQTTAPMALLNDIQHHVVFFCQLSCKSDELHIQFNSPHNSNKISPKIKFKDTDIKYKINDNELEWHVNDKMKYKHKIKNKNRFYPFMILKLKDEYNIKIVLS